jgi:NAD(P)-dependent dehydrogenase (short-subunit alcohol dehydrogenase family)
MADAMQDKVWFITGANSGFGLALSKAVLSRGGVVAAAIRSPKDQSVATLKDLHEDNLHVGRLDVTNTQDVQVAVDQAVERFGRLDVVVNSAGRGSFGTLEETPDTEVRDLFEVNFFGSLNVFRAVLPTLRSQRHGHLVQISSLAGIAPPAPGLGAYAATKFAVEGISEVLAKEVAHLGIGVTIVEPGDFRTGFGNALHVTPPALQDYAESVGSAARSFASMDPTQLGDPDNAAAVIIKTKLTDQLVHGQAWEAVGRGVR